MPPHRRDLPVSAMEYGKFGDTYLVRLDRGEEILEQLEALARRENIALATVQALGAVDRFTVGAYDTAKQEYKANEFAGSFEIVSLTGTIDQKDGRFYAHLHMSAGDVRGRVFGGHLNKARISATCEMAVRVLPGRVNREKDPETGLNLWTFPA